MLELKNVTVSFDGKRVVDNLSVTLPQIGLVTISGPSGRGKTTLLRAIMGLQKYKGEIKFDRTPVFSAVFQESNLLPWLTATENVAVVASLDNGHMSQAKMLLSQVGFDDADFDKRPSELSVGMKRRVAAARAMMIPSDVLILDEPFAGLDEKNIEIVSKLLLSERERRLILLVTHVGDFNADYEISL